MNPDPNEIFFDCPKCNRPMSGDKALVGEMINCPDCGEAFTPTPREPEPAPEPSPEPKAAKPKNFTAIVGIVLLIGGLFWFKSWREGQGYDESYAHRLARYRAGAEQAVRVACTNEVIGLRQFISMDVSTYGQNVKEWTATATVEYINQLGGIDRTNLELQFDTLGGDLGCYKKDKPWHLPETP